MRGPGMFVQTILGKNYRRQHTGPILVAVMCSYWFASLIYISVFSVLEIVEEKRLHSVFIKSQ